MALVDSRYKDFSARMDNYRQQLEKTLGIQQTGDDQQKSTQISNGSNRSSDSNLESKLNDEKRRSARRKEFIMAELLQTERTYVKDLEVSINTYLFELHKQNSTGALPAALRDKERLIFSNIEQIYDFHKSIFLRELEKYETMPEDVGHCFVTWAQKFDIYVHYCKNKPESNMFLVQPVCVQFFDEVSVLLFELLAEN